MTPDRCPTAARSVVSDGLTLRAADYGGTVVLSLIGRLDLSTYPVLRDGLVGYLAEQPTAVVVVLGPGFELGSDPLAATFALVRERCRTWPRVPLAVVATVEPHRRMLRRTDLRRFVPCFDSVAEALAARAPERERAAVRLTGDDLPYRAGDVTRRTCTAWGGLHGATPRAVLLAIELTGVARALGEPTPLLRIERFPDQLTISVRHTRTPPTPEPLPTRVHRLGAACGRTPLPGGGEVVWAVITLA
ncbi:hypothetical protein AB0A74_14450 [Saccharothrix sp. NPDC042600]|uniref:hypothetical protein n=1 Tax=Saccharothrix TaxID=2071 RepID=UPI0033CF5F65|nr:hypothetical protein GCM10017745_59320 [Saccharothrix mutabilis subsp. capreolus]